ncbi:aminotransferase class III-fold pyridoxal phosphate-dependent enzyme [Defluviimonas sp. WL0002]|uniref:Aminotransferase class III-fold pyridoxal phosphate-dependent enzyme n=1 Tax=Albidovulum marisflavi TaxID=2984159 RepID=A0ABT2ZDF2_9RHOB|nr:aminotransferase class III-fold pyridoxal phosphate-dependent enzyme [Defluviimonas sp. WL0002]MCV2869154.1 aminotransferase class III-fold pyridoxal phosphate-dependent enzyme [Defluviimonas sp. WL0002]
MSPFETPPPALDPVTLAELARRHWGLQGTIHSLISERDQNARLDAPGGRYVLKVSNAGEDAGQIALQAAVLKHLEDQGLAGIPRLVPTLAGEDGAEVETGHGPGSARIVTWVDGPLLSSAPRTLAQLESLGRFMGRLSRAMQGFGHPAAFRDEFLWSLDNAAGIASWASDIDSPDRRALVEALFDRYRRRVAPRLAGLRVSVLHQDANDNNVIVEAANANAVAGLIDFGDMAHGRTINELAITMAYALLDAPDLYAAMRSLISGYVAAFPITEDEAEVLYDLMRMRLVMSVCISSRRAKENANNAYLTISQRPAFALLERLDGIDPEFMVALCRKAAGFDATRGAVSVRDFLAQAGVAPVVSPDPQRAARVALLTDGTHPDMPAFFDRAFDAWFSAQRPAGLPANVAFYGFGPYGENRSVYTASHFADAASPERRTRHTGIDIFAAKGTPVNAPLAGKVTNVTYNADPLDYGHTLILEHETSQGVRFWTLYGHLASTLPTIVQPGQRVEAGQLVGHFGDWHENGGWSPHLHFQVMSDMLAQDQGNFFGVGHDSLWDLWSDICIDPNLILRLAPESFRADPHPPAELLERRAKAIGPSLSISYAEKLKIVRGQGPWLVDHTGRRFLDAVNNITHVGHCHPHVVAAIARQAGILNTNTRYLSELMLDFSERLTAKLPGDLKVAYFVNSGTEANELALRIARTAIGKKSTVVLDWAYHGNSGGMVDVSPYKFKRRGGYPQPDFVEIASFPDPYRGPHKGRSEAAGRAYANDVARCLERVRSKTGSAAAAFIAESISGVGGQVGYPDGYLRAAYEHVRAAGGVCIADEVQCGFGRVGAAFWGFELQGVVPDVVVMGKPIGNGHPLGAVVTTPDLAAKFANGMEYFNSFGGNPVSMAVGMAVLDVIEGEGLQERALETGRYMLDRFHDLAKRWPLIGDVRGWGLFSGVELVRDRQTLEPATDEAGWIVNHIRRQGVLASTDGPFDNVLKFKPPMVFGRAEADILCDALEAAFAGLAAIAPGA